MKNNKAEWIPRTDTEKRINNDKLTYQYEVRSIYNQQLFIGTLKEVSYFVNKSYRYIQRFAHDYDYFSVKYGSMIVYIKYIGKKRVYTKTCKICKQNKSIYQFWSIRGRRDTVCSTCRAKIYQEKKNARKN